MIISSQQLITVALLIPNPRESAYWYSIWPTGHSETIGVMLRDVLFIKGTAGCCMVTLVNLYLPDSNQVTFLELVLAKRSEFAEGTVILGGEFNFTMDSVLDASISTTHLSYAALKRLKKSFHAFHLVDVWCILHPNHWDYTFYSHPHYSYTRIYLFMFPKSLLSKVKSTSIGQITLSDHALFFVDVDLLSPTPKPWMWKLNDSLMQTPSVTEGV